MNMKCYQRLFQNFSFEKATLDLMGETGLLTGFPKAIFKTNRVLKIVLQIVCIVFLLAALGIQGLEAQSQSGNSGNSLKGMSLNGSTGLYSIPTGRIGWERTRDIGLDLGYHAIITDGQATHIPKASVSLFKWVEVSAAFDIQPDGYLGNDRGTDFIGGAKIQFPFTKTAIALGGNFQSLNFLSGDDSGYNAGQVYVAVTYAGQFFSWPAETTVVVGKTFGRNSPNWNIDYGMGFDLVLLPNILDRYVHWITDFSNFSYSVEAFGADPVYRGVVNTGLRVDLSLIPALSKFKFVIDVLVTDVFDKTRAFSVGAVFGIPIL